MREDRDHALRRARKIAQTHTTVPEVIRRSPDGILLVARNPVDVLTSSSRLSRFPTSRVIGSGTILDTARFRHFLSEHFSVDPRSVHAFTIGEHGDREVPVSSLASIAAMQLRTFCAAQQIPYDEAAHGSIFRRRRDAAYELIARKRATYDAIGAGLLRLVEAIMRDQSSVLSVSSLIDDYYA